VSPTFRLLRPRAPLPGRTVIALSALGILLGLHLVAMLFSLFQNVYLNSFFYVPGFAVRQVYWNSFRFALGASLTLLLFIAVLATLILWHLSGADRRSRW
jgi:hypothetical protein